MSVYWATCALSMGMYAFATKTAQYKKHIWFAILVSGLPLFLLSALRYGIGTDYNSYIYIYMKNGCLVENRV